MEPNKVRLVNLFIIILIIMFLTKNSLDITFYYKSLDLITKPNYTLIDGNNIQTLSKQAKLYSDKNCTNSIGNTIFTSTISNINNILLDTFIVTFMLPRGSIQCVSSTDKLIKVNDSYLIQSKEPLVFNIVNGTDSYINSTGKVILYTLSNSSDYKCYVKIYFD